MGLTSRGLPNCTNTNTRVFQRDHVGHLQCQEEEDDSDWKLVGLTSRRQPNGANTNTHVFQGDSGGPLQCREDEDSDWELVGLTSWGMSGCSTRYPSVYAKV